MQAFGGNIALTSSRIADFVIYIPEWFTDLVSGIKSTRNDAEKWKEVRDKLETLKIVRNNFFLRFLFVELS